MRYLEWILKGILFILLLGFAVKNSDVVTLNYYLGYQWQAPLVLVILMFFVAGAVVGVAACMGYLFRQRRELARLRKDAQARQIALPDET
ncbi:MAG TPA: lipopolysaccharide assembly protein LapA domain-containing protein [Sulfuriferula sp.]|nr:lipopolysaccharide assembly protein LapA domain-containing protein [Sulfuriferula sp.]